MCPTLIIMCSFIHFYIYLFMYLSTQMYFTFVSDEYFHLENDFQISFCFDTFIYFFNSVLSLV